jgi:AcrR family transcriptional regulator
MPSQENPKSHGSRDGDTEAQILRAAQRVFVRRGTAGARMQEIAEEAGVNQALLHYYFRSKDRLAEAVFREAAGRLIPAALRVMESGATLEEKIEQFVQLYIDAVRQTPFLPGYVLAEIHHHPERFAALIESAGGQAVQVAGALRERLRAQLDAAAAAGTMRAIEPEQFIVNLLGLSVVPFIARPMLRLAFEMDDAAFDRFLNERRAELPRFIVNGLRP